MGVRQKLEKLERLIKEGTRVYTFEERDEVFSLPDREEIYFDYTPIFNALRRARGMEEVPEGHDILKVEAGEVKALIRFTENLMRKRRG